MKVEKAQKSQRKVLSQPTRMGYDYPTSGGRHSGHAPTSPQEETMPSNPVTITEKTVVYLPNRHPARVWKSEPGTVSFNLACEGGWADQVYDRLADWARTYNLLADIEKDEEADLPDWNELMALVPADRRLEAVRAAFDDRDAIIVDNPVKLVWDTSIRGGETLRDDGAVIQEDFCNPVEDCTVHLEVIDPEGLGIDDPTDWRAWNEPISGPWWGLADGFTVDPDDDEPIDPTDGEPYDDAEERLLRKAGIDRSSVWDVSTPW